MKKHFLFLIIACCSFSFITAQEWGSVDGNTVTVKDIAPVWPGCESDSAAERDNCFDEQLTKHIINNYRYPAEAYKNNEQGRVLVEFIINTDGLVEIQKVSGGTKALQEEAKRNISAIPKMAKPGMSGGKPKAIQFTVPITFSTGK